MLAPGTRKTLTLEKLSCDWNLMESYITLAFKSPEPSISAGNAIFYWVLNRMISTY